MNRILWILNFENKNITGHILHNLQSSSLLCFSELHFARDDLTWHPFTSKVGKIKDWLVASCSFPYFSVYLLYHSAGAHSRAVCVFRANWMETVKREDKIIPSYNANSVLRLILLVSIVYLEKWGLIFYLILAFLKENSISFFPYLSRKYVWLIVSLPSALPSAKTLRLTPWRSI